MAFDPTLLPDFDAVAREQARQQAGGRSFVGSALATGTHELLGQVAGAGEVVGRLIGSDRLTQGSMARQAERRAAAEASARPEYQPGGPETWSPSGIAYNVLKSLPSLGAMVGGTVAVGAALPAVLPGAAMTGLTRLGMAAPEMIGGGAGAARAAQSAAAVGDLSTAWKAQQAAKAAGEHLAKTAVGGLAAAYPLSVGQNMQAAHEGGRTPGRAEAAQALALGVPQAALGAVAPVGLTNRWALRMGEGVLARSAAGAAVMGPAMGLQGAANTWMTQQMGDPNKSTSERFREVVQSFLHGAVTGGVVGGALHAVSPAARPAAEQFKPQPTPETTQVTAPTPTPTPGASPVDVEFLANAKQGDLIQPEVDRAALETARAENAALRQRRTERDFADTELGRTASWPETGNSVGPQRLPPNEMDATAYRDMIVGEANPRHGKAATAFLEQAGVGDDVSLYRVVAAERVRFERDGKTPPAWLSALSDRAGVTENGAPLDHARNVADAQAAVEKAQARLDRRPDVKSNRTALDKALARLDIAQQRHDFDRQALGDIYAERDRMIAERVQQAEQAAAQDRLANATQPDMIVDLEARQRAEQLDQDVVETATQQRQRAKLDKIKDAEADRAQRDLYTDETFSQTPLGDQRLRELGDAELKLRAVIAESGVARVPLKLRQTVKTALSAIDRGDALTTKQEQALKDAYARLGFKATDGDMMVQRPRDNVQGPALDVLSVDETAARRAAVEAGLARDPNAPTPSPRISGDVDLAEPVPPATLGAIARKTREAAAKGEIAPIRETVDPTGRNVFEVERSVEDRDRTKVAEVLRDAFDVVRTPADVERTQVGDALRTRTERTPTGVRIQDQGRNAFVVERPARTPEETIAETAHATAQTPEERASLTLNDVPTPEAVAEIAADRALNARRRHADAIVEKLRLKRAQENTTPRAEAPDIAGMSRDDAVQAAFEHFNANGPLPGVAGGEAVERIIAKAASGKQLTQSEGSTLLNALKRETGAYDARAFGRRVEATPAERAAAKAEAAQRYSDAATERAEMTRAPTDLAAAEQARRLSVEAADRAAASRVSADVAQARIEQQMALRMDPIERIDRPMYALEVTPPAKWTEGMFADRKLTHMISDGDYAIMRGQNVLGDPIYVGLRRDGGMLSRSSVQAMLAGPTWSDKDIVRFNELARAAQDHEARLTKENPDGFFAGGKTFVATRGVPQHVSAFVERVARLTGFDGRLYVTTFDELQRLPPQPGRFGAIEGLSTGDPSLFGQMKPLGEGDFAIALKPGIGKMAMMEAAAHEFGHAYKLRMEAGLPADVKAALDAAYKEYRTKHATGDFSDLVDDLRGWRAARQAKERSDRNLRVDEMHPSDRNYWLSRDEWTADQISRWAMRHEPATSVVDRFFQTVGRQLRKIYDALIGERAKPDLTFAQYLDGVSRRVRAGEIEKAYAGVSDLDVAHTPLSGRRGASAPTVDEQNAAMADVAARTKEFARTVGEVFAAPNVGERVRKTFWGFMPAPQLATHVEPITAAPKAFDDAARRRDTARNKMSEVLAPMINDARRLPKPARDAFHRLQAFAEQGVDPTRPIEQHGWYTVAEREQMKAAHGEATKEYHRFRQIAPDEAKGLFDRVQTNMRTLRALDAGEDLFDHIAPMVDESIVKEFRNPFERIRMDDELRVSGEESVAAAVRGDIRHNLALLDGYVSAQRQKLNAQIAAADRQGRAAGDGARDKLRAETDRVDFLEKLLSDKRKVIENPEPYAHSGRFGDYFVSAKLVSEKGVVRDETRQGLADLLRERNFKDYTINELPEQNRLFIRVETANEAQRLHDALKERGGKLFETDDDNAMRVGMSKTIGDFASEFRTSNQYLLNKLKERTRADETMSPEARAQNERTIASLTRLIFESLPVSSIQRINAFKRQVHGADPDKVQSLAFRTQAALHYLSNRAYSRELLARQRDMEADVSRLQREGDIDKVNVATHAMRELLQREHERAGATQVDRAVSLIKQATNGFYLFGAPAHVVQMLSQPFVTAFPEMAKVYGHAPAATALMKNLPVAIRVMRAVANRDNTAASLTRAGLRKAGLTADKIDTLMRAENAGALSTAGFIHDIGDAARGSTRSEYGGKIEHAMQIAGMLNTYAETASRVMVALAAHDLHTAKHGDVGRQMYVDKVVFAGMGEMSARAAMRYEGMNPGTRIMFQFSRYPAYLLSKLYSETYNVFSKNATPQARAEAKTYLLAHLAAVGTLAGTLSFPGAEMFFGLGTKVANQITGKDDYDLEGSYRKFLLSTFGAGLGDVVAKGAPRALGIDLSRTLGEGGVIPFTKLLADRRKLEDRMQDWALDTMGASVSTGARLVEGARDYLDGNYLRGMQKLLPTALRGPYDAYHMSRYGWETAAGKPLAIASPPTTGEIVWRAVGMSPLRKASASEMSNASQQLQAARDYRAGVIRENLLRSVNHGDQSGFRHWAGKAQEMALDHPESPILAGLAQAIRQQRVGVATGVALGTPAGVNPMDMNRRSMLFGYGMGLR